MTTTAGHRVLPHTAGTAIEAWVPDKAACIAEAVQAMVGSFADVRGAILAESVTLRFAPDDRDLLVQVLNEVISQQRLITGSRPTPVVGGLTAAGFSTLLFDLLTPAERRTARAPLRHHDAGPPTSPAS